MNAPAQAVSGLLAGLSCGDIDTPNERVRLGHLLRLGREHAGDRFAKLRTESVGTLPDVSKHGRFPPLPVRRLMAALQDQPRGLEERLIVNWGTVAPRSPGA
jgi:hypothetical protein